MTNKELLAELRKPGKIEMPVLHSHGVQHFIIEKSDLINHVAELDGNKDSYWKFYDIGDNGGVRRLDVNVSDRIA